jgi:heme/copper-type cytochrome/quinol oxidase subunit 2
VQPFILISILVFALIVVGALVLVAFTMRKSSADSIQSDQEAHPRGYWVSLGISIGAGFGVAIGSALEQKNKDQIRPPTEQEQKMQKWGVVLGLLMLLVFAGIFTFILVMRSR